MPTSPATVNLGPSITQIPKRFYRGLNPIRALRRMRIRPQRTHDEAEELPPGRRALQTSIVALDIASSVAETVPVFGPPLKGALEGFCKILKLIEQRFENAEGVVEFTDRLDALLKVVTDVREPHPPLQTLIGKLHAIERKLRLHLSKQRIRLPAVAKALADASLQVDRCLMDFNVATLLAIMATVRVPAVERLALECLTVLDPFGTPQKVLRVDMRSIEIVGMLVLNRYEAGSPERLALNGFVSGGLYELTMDDGRHVLSLTDILIESVNAGSKVVMNVVVVKVTAQQDGVVCPICQAPMSTSQQDRVFCAKCGRGVSAVGSLDRPLRGAEQIDAADPTPTSFCNITISHQRVLSPSRQDPLDIQERPDEASRTVQQLPGVDEASRIQEHPGAGEVLHVQELPNADEAPRTQKSPDTNKASRSTVSLPTIDNATTLLNYAIQAIGGPHVQWGCTEELESGYDRINRRNVVYSRRKIIVVTGAHRRVPQGQR